MPYEKFKVICERQNLDFEVRIPGFSKAEHFLRGGGEAPLDRKIKIIRTRGNEMPSGFF